MVLILVSFACSGIGDCFVAGTQITMSSGLHKDIEDVRIGETVLSYNVEEEVFVDRDVVNLIRKSSNEIFTIETTSSYFEGVTAEHPFYQPDIKSWVPVNELHVGDQVLVSSQGRKSVERIVDLDTKHLKRAVDVYNMSVDGPEHNYFANDVLVHNKQYSMPTPFMVKLIDISDDGFIPADVDTLFSANLYISEEELEQHTEDLILQVTWEVVYEGQPASCDKEIQLSPYSIPEMIELECQYVFNSEYFTPLELEAGMAPAAITINIGVPGPYLGVTDTLNVMVKHTDESTDTGE